MADNISTIKTQLGFIRESLLTLFQGVSGQCAVVSNVSDLWNQSQQNSQIPMGYVCYAGESPWSSAQNLSALTHRVSRDWVVRVKQGRGYTADRGATVFDFVDFVEKVRDAIRAMLGISEDNGNDYAGIKPVRLGDQVIDCYDILFSTKNDLPTVLMQPDNDVFE